MNSKHIFRAALFDFDGVIMDTESQYSIFWGKQGKLYHPEIPHFDQKIKGQTLIQIFDKYFTNQLDLQNRLTNELNDFEQSMNYSYIKGAEELLKKLRINGIHTALVTSSNAKKMDSVYQSHPELKEIFDEIITSERFVRSKPDPECFLLGARLFHALPQECVVFEDSFHGLAAGKAAGMKVIGLATTNPRPELKGKADYIVNDLSEVNMTVLNQLIESNF